MHLYVYRFFTGSFALNFYRTSLRGESKHDKPKWNRESKYYKLDQENQKRPLNDIDDEYDDDRDLTNNEIYKLDSDEENDIDEHLNNINLNNIDTKNKKIKRL